jgi:molybdopterin converting factor small subunit
MPFEAVKEETVNTTVSPEERHIQVETVAWVTRFVGGNGSDRISFDLVTQPGDTVRTALRQLSERFPQLQYALWDPETGELGEHIEVVVNGAILGVRHTLDSALQDGDRILLFGQYMGG